MHQRLECNAILLQPLSIQEPPFPLALLIRFLNRGKRLSSFGQPLVRVVLQRAERTQHGWWDSGGISTKHGIGRRIGLSWFGLGSLRVLLSLLLLLYGISWQFNRPGFGHVGILALVLCSMVEILQHDSFFLVHGRINHSSSSSTNCCWTRRPSWSILSLWKRKRLHWILVVCDRMMLFHVGNLQLQTGMWVFT